MYIPGRSEGAIYMYLTSYTYDMLHIQAMERELDEHGELRRYEYREQTLNLALALALTLSLT